MSDVKGKILCVHDDGDVLQFLRTVLEQAGYQLSCATNDEEGLRCFKDVGPDLIIVDLMMEEVDSGTSLVTDLGALGNKAPIYLLSSAGRELGMMSDYNDLGLAGVFQKPIDPDRLLNIVGQRLKDAK